MALHLAGREAGVGSRGPSGCRGSKCCRSPTWSRPRLDVTLRVSGLFRDVFPDAHGAVCPSRAGPGCHSATRQRDWNPYAGQATGPRGCTGRHRAVTALAWARIWRTATTEDSRAAKPAQAWLKAPAPMRWTVTEATRPGTRAAYAARVAQARTALCILQDLPETDILLLAADYADPRGRLCRRHRRPPAARQAALYHHLDATRSRASPAPAPCPRKSRGWCRARAAQPRLARQGCMRHGFRGGRRDRRDAGSHGRLCASGRGRGTCRICSTCITTRRSGDAQVAMPSLPGRNPGAPIRAMLDQLQRRLHAGRALANTAQFYRRSDGDRGLTKAPEGPPAKGPEYQGLVSRARIAR